MLGRELDELDCDRPRRRRARRPLAATPVLRRDGHRRRKGIIEPTDLDVYRRRGRRHRRPARLGSHRARPAASTAPTAPTHGHDRGRAARLATAHDAPARDRPRHRLLVGGPPCRGHHRRPDRRREHRARHPGQARLAAPGAQAPSRTRSSTEYIAALGVRPANPNALVRNLSGGNQQKVLLARWLATAPAAADPRRADARHRRRREGRDPAQGRRAGRAAGWRSIFISSELEEVLRLSQRIVVMRDRRKIGELALARRRRRRHRRLHRPARAEEGAA